VRGTVPTGTGMAWFAFLRCLHLPPPLATGKQSGEHRRKYGANAFYNRDRLPAPSGGRGREEGAAPVATLTTPKTPTTIRLPHLPLFGQSSILAIYQQPYRAHNAALSFITRKTKARCAYSAGGKPLRNTALLSRSLRALHLSRAVKAGFAGMRAFKCVHA